MSDSVLSRDEVVRVSGGYARPADQLRALHAMGFYRARLGKVSRQVILERPHYDAVASGLGSAANETNRPTLRPLRRVK